MDSFPNSADKLFHGEVLMLTWLISGLPTLALLQPLSIANGLIAELGFTGSLLVLMGVTWHFLGWLEPPPDAFPRKYIFAFRTLGTFTIIFTRLSFIGNPTPFFLATELGSIPLTALIDVWLSRRTPPRHHQLFCLIIVCGILMTCMSCHITANGVILALFHAVLTTCQQLVLYYARGRYRRGAPTQSVGALFLQSQAFIFQGMVILGTCGLAVAFLPRSVVNLTNTPFPIINPNATAGIAAQMNTLGDHQPVLADGVVTPEVLTFSTFEVSTLWGIPRYMFSPSPEESWAQMAQWQVSPGNISSGEKSSSNGGVHPNLVSGRLLKFITKGQSLQYTFYGCLLLNVAMLTAAIFWDWLGCEFKVSLSSRRGLWVEFSTLRQWLGPKVVSETSAIIIVFESVILARAAFMALVVSTNRYHLFLLIGDSAIVAHGAILACLGALFYSADVQREVFVDNTIDEDFVHNTYFIDANRNSNTYAV